MNHIKKIIKNILKQNKALDIEIHIDIIKEVIFYISEVILIMIKYEEYDIDKIFIEINEMKDIEEIHIDIQRYKCKNYLNEDYKKEIIKNLVKYDKEEIKQFSLGELYESFTTSREKKYLGQVYTPKNIVVDMIDENIKEEDIIENPYYKVIDPACGGGYFLLGAYEKIKKIIDQNYDRIIDKHKHIKNELEKGIHQFILKNNIWGTDIDEFAIYMTKFSLIIKGNIEDIQINIFKKDLLICDDNNFDNSFDLVLCNPPYIGHKKIDVNYRKALVKRYSDVYSNKADVSYCFFKKSYELLKYNGNLSIITSRYFQEALSAKSLRTYIKKSFKINKVIDFYGESVFKGIGISPVIIHSTKCNSDNNKIIVYKGMNEFTINQDGLNDNGWILLSKKEKKLFDKINSTGDVKIKDICVFNQGIITGCDKAFILSEKEINKYQIEKCLIKPWIKNSNIDKYYIKDTDQYIIYSNTIDEEENYPNAIKYIKNHEDRLKKRRECIKGFRKWYQLQWGRDESLFKKDKIVFPYKSDENKFAISTGELCASADVYFITINENHKELVTLEYLTAFFNSSLFEYYFKCVAKKLSEKLYDYYPNKLIELNIRINLDSEIDKLVKDISSNYDNRIKIDNYFYNIYNLSKDEIAIVKNSTSTEGR